jgi:peptidoglycan/xylan/chitin deacetylase (PgdA/CDA1 family)
MLRIDPIARYFVNASRGAGPLILMYHSVSRGRSPPEWLWSVALGRFIDQIELLRDAGWQFRKVSDLANKASPQEGTVAITFDDGYLNNYPAFEALATRGLPASWFVVSGNVGQPAAWSDEVTTGWPMLDSDQLLEMSQAGMEIGGHTRHHCRLAEIGAAQLQDQIRGCREDLEQILGDAVTSFAYPYGSHSDQVVAATRAAGYRIACTTRAGSAFADGDLLKLRRLAVYSHDNLSSFGRKVGLMRNEASWGRVLEYVKHRIERLNE